MRNLLKEKPDTATTFTIICSVVIGALVVGLILSILRIGSPTHDSYASVYEAADIIGNEYYFMQDDQELLAQNIIRSMLAGIDDPYAHYYTETEYQGMLQEDTGDYQGIGISVLPPDATGSCILVVYPDSPMDDAGAKAGDYITSVNGVQVSGLPMDDFLLLFSDEDGGSDTLEMLRGVEAFSLHVTRRAVHVTRVYSELLSDRTGYIRIEQFIGTVVPEFIAAVEDFEEQHVKGMIIDLRDNPGGGLSEVLGIAHALLPKGALISTIQSRHGTENAYYANGSDNIASMPIVILVNGNSASASELLSAALQDNNIACIVGTQTFGKGIVQSYYRLKNGAGWIKLTTDAYFTPNGLCIHGTGITPDYTVPQSVAWEDKVISMIPHNEDQQLNAALEILEEILRKAA